MSVMKQSIKILLFTLLAAMSAAGAATATVVVDSLTRQPLPGASVFSRRGNAIGTADSHGRLPYVPPGSSPVTVRYIGYGERTVDPATTDTVFMTELPTELLEIVVQSKQHKVLHVLAYVREYSTLSTFTDTVFLFREKMVDYMIAPDRKVKFDGWRSPRVLKSKSYYRFTAADGSDSVSSRCNHHFSWSDWIGIVPSPGMPLRLKDAETGTDTVMGRYSPAEIWTRNDGRVTVDVNVLADTTSRRWVRNLSVFFKEHLDFDTFRLHYSYGNVTGDSIALTDLAAYSFSIESKGRGREMFMFNRRDESFDVSTFGDVYILDKEFITLKEARNWSKRKFDSGSIEIIEPADAPELQPDIKTLIARVDAIDHDGVRLDFTPDRRLKSERRKPQNIAQRALTMLKDMTGITAVRARRNFNNNWSSFKKSRREREMKTEEK